MVHVHTYCHAKSQVPSLTNVWFMVILVSLMAVDSCKTFVYFHLVHVYTYFYKTYQVSSFKNELTRTIVTIGKFGAARGSSWFYNTIKQIFEFISRVYLLVWCINFQNLVRIKKVRYLSIHYDKVNINSLQILRNCLNFNKFKVGQEIEKDEIIEKISIHQ